MESPCREAAAIGKATCAATQRMVARRGGGVSTAGKADSAAGK